MILDIIQSDRLEVYLQSIVSVKNKKIMAFEALLRAYDSDGEHLSPVWLFEQARKENLSLRLDQIARIKAIEKFKPYFDENPSLLLFLNFESSSIDKEFDRKRYLFVDKLQTLGIPFKNIVLEVKEDEIKNTQALEEFCQYYKGLGFNIALDDFGTGNSSFDRLSVIAPTIVKVDRSIIYNIDDNYINTEILKAISKMCEKIGALVLAEGVESEEEILTCMQARIDIYQGYWFAKPSKDIKNVALIYDKVVYLTQKFIKNRQDVKNKKASLFKEADALTSKLLTACVNNKKDNRKQLKTLIRDVENVEAVYVIDASSSCQIGETIMNVIPHGFYEPSVEGEDHSLKEYVYMTKISKKDSHMTARYISGASGNMCYTFSKKLELKGKEMIFCVDIYEKNECSSQ